MIFGNESISTYTRGNLSIWMILAFQAGLLNTGGYMACHNFVSHVTGFATLFGLGLGERNYGHALAVLLVPACFLGGAMISGILVDLRLQLGRKPRYYIAFGVLFALLLLVEIAGWNKLWGTFGEGLVYKRDYALLGLLCLICGLQNALVSLVSKSVVRTTHLTGVTTDLGIGLIRTLNRGRLGKKVAGEGQANLMRIGVIIFFVLGSAAGYQLFYHFKFRGFLFPTMISGALFFVTFYFQVIRKRLHLRAES